MGRDSWVKAVVANADGEIYDLEGYAAVGMDGSRISPMTTNEAIPMPYGSELMLLPERLPLVYNIGDQRLEVLSEDPYEPGAPIYPVAVFNSPGYVITRTAAYEEIDGARILPMFSYGAAGWADGEFQSAAAQVDTEPRQDLRQMRMEDVETGIAEMRDKLPGNRLRRHLERCATEYGCPAGKNFFLHRYEAPLPTSRTCNARCLGCISLQNRTDLQSSQNRIDFVPSPEEIAGVALAHIAEVPNAVVSFGQGCEGDPLMVADAITPAVRWIRENTDRGTINMNTNGSRPDTLDELFDAGLDSIRVSMNSVRPACYETYFRPVDYGLPDVLESISRAVSRGVFVSINYLNCPGFTDTPEEIEALMAFLDRFAIGMIQWRNLNFDPMRYLEEMADVEPASDPVGMEVCLERIREHAPGVMFGYFNPPRSKWSQRK